MDLQHDITRLLSRQPAATRGPFACLDPRCRLLNMQGEGVLYGTQHETKTHEKEQRGGLKISWDDQPENVLTGALQRLATAKPR